MGNIFPKSVENTNGKAEIALNKQLFHTLLLKYLYCRHIKTEGFAWERVKFVPV